MEQTYNGWTGNGDRDAPTTAEDAEAFARSIYPDDTPDMDPGDMDVVNWTEIAEHWAVVRVS